MPGKVNYLIGTDPAQWHTGVPTYGEIAYSNLYPGVNLTYSGTEGQLKGTYTLAPGAKPSSIIWQYAGAEKVAVDPMGNLQITVHSALQVTEQAPTAWQEIGGQRIPVSARYAINADSSIGFLLGSYDSNYPLTIDPTITYSTYLGGFFSDGASAIVLDGAGNIYIAGATGSSDFPLQNPYQPVFAGGDNDAFVAKLTADGSALIYSTYLGGNSGGGAAGSDGARSISVDASGNVNVGGFTTSLDFPVTQGAYQTIYGGTEDLFMTRLNSTGSDLIFSTFYGDAGVEEPGGFVTDAAGNIYFTCYTFPNRNSYALVGEISADGSNLVFVHSLGGEIPGPGNENTNTAGEGIAVDAANNIYVTGHTRAADFPVTAGAYRTSIEAFEDGFVTKYSPSGQQMIYSTYLPGGVSDYAYRVQVDAQGSAYISGWTSSSDYPVTANAFQATYGGNIDGFVTKLNPAGSALVYSTFLGGDSPEITYGLSLDDSNSLYVAGYTQSADFPTVNPIQGALQGSSDAYVVKLRPSGTQADYSTYLGGTGDDGAGAVWVDNNGNAYVVGATTSTNFPILNPLQATNHGQNDVFITKIFDPSGIVSPTPTLTGTPPTATPTATATACVPSPNYRFISSNGNALVPGSADIGNHCEDCTTAINLPFAIMFYGQSFSAANVSSNGNIQFLSDDETGLTECAPFSFFNYVIAPYQADLNTEAGGIFTSITGVAPNRIFNIEWRACVYDLITFQCDENINFEARLYEGSPVEQIDFIYGQMDHNNGIPAVVLLQQDTGSHLTQYSCNQPILQSGLRIEFTRNTCASPTPTATGTPPTSTPTRTALPPSPTPDACLSVTPWRNELPMPIPHSGSAAAVVNNQLYVIGGASNSPTPARYTQRFDPAANAWATASPVPDGVGIAFSQAAGLGNKIYMVGSTYPPDERFIEVYDTTADSWSRAATLPEPLSSGGLAAYNGKIYLFGGQIVNQLPTTHVYMYDPTTDTITAKAPMSSGQAEIGAATVGNRIYVVGGYQYIHYAYDPGTDTWSTIAAPLTPNFSVPGVFSFNGELWVTTGRDNFNRHGYPPNQEIQIYNPTTNQWRFGPALNVPRYYSTAVGVINGRAYIVGGIDLNSETYPYVYLSSMESIAYVECGTATPIATGATATRTATAPPHTSTPTVATTSTPCAINFSDVPADNTFYSFVRCLACRGIISGYTDGTFRPNNDITRGQIAKIVSNAAGFSEDPGPQVYEDVPMGSPFYDWINRLSMRGHMGGYLCGLVPEEPCIAPDNRPYFRPTASATRGQLAKIVSNAAGLGGDPTGLFYTDVPEEHPFYVWIMRLTQLGVMGGYLCGGEGEPCDGDNHPYFRPYNNVTRGQASKIVANTFFPNCQLPARP
jgi:N-acetylneuraminic acid mutarotase